MAMEELNCLLEKQLRARRRAEQIRAIRAKKTPDRRGPKQAEDLAELKQLRVKKRQLADRYKDDT
jgi:hypothetical protein